MLWGLKPLYYSEKYSFFIKAEFGHKTPGMAPIRSNPICQSAVNLFIMGIGLDHFCPDPVQS